jgi:hypothetical protein
VFEPLHCKTSYSAPRWHALALSLLVAGMMGCDPGPEPAPPRPAAPAPEAPRQTSQVRCDEILQSALEQLEPRSLGISADSDSVIRYLREWTGRCGSRNKTFAVPDAFVAAMTEPERENLGALKFGVRDIEVLREAALFKAVATEVTSSAKTDAEKVTQVFDHVIRIVAMAPASMGTLPFTAADRYLVGVGGGRDRVMVLAGILRQLRIETLAIEFPVTDDRSNLPTLAGVLLDGELRLYDPTLGEPVRVNRRDVASPVVTLKELLATPSVLETYSGLGGELSRLKPEDLVKARLACVGQASLWSQRMQDLQQSVAGANAITAAEFLADSELGPGLLSRAAKAAGNGIGAETIVPWSYVSGLIPNRDRPDEAQQRQLYFLTGAWAAPFNVDTDERGQPKLGSPMRTFLRLRLALAAGDAEEALAAFPSEVILPCRALRMMALPDEVRFQAEDAANEATYWMALCQFDRGEFRVAVDSCDRYLRAARQAMLVGVLQGAGKDVPREAIKALETSFEETFRVPGEKSLAYGLEVATGVTLSQPVNDSQRRALAFLEGVYRRIGAMQLLKAKSYEAQNDRKAAVESLKSIPGTDAAAVEAAALRSVWSDATTEKTADKSPDKPSEAPANAPASKPEAEQPVGTSPDEKKPKVDALEDKKPGEKATDEKNAPPPKPEAPSAAVPDAPPANDKPSPTAPPKPGPAPKPE